MRVPEGYFAILFKEAGSKTIGVRFPEHPGIVTYGVDWKEAEKNAAEALSAALESDFERHFKLPPAKKPKARSGQKTVFIKLDQEIRLAYLLREWRTEADLTQAEMAHKLGISYQAYQRMERPGRANLTVVTLEKVARALNRELVLDLRRPRYKLAGGF
jgi:antitoxin HicB